MSTHDRAKSCETCQVQRVSLYLQTFFLLNGTKLVAGKQPLLCSIPFFIFAFHSFMLLDSWTLGLLDEMSQNSSNTFKDYIQRCSNLWKSLFQQEIRIKVQPDPEYSNMLKWWGVPTSWGKRNGHRVKLSRAESSWVKLTNSSHLVTEFLPDSDPPVTRCLFANQPPATYGKAQSGRILAWLGWWYLRAGFSHPAKHAVYCA